MVITHGVALKFVQSALHIVPVRVLNETSSITLHLGEVHVSGLPGNVLQVLPRSPRGEVGHHEAEFGAPGARAIPGASAAGCTLARGRAALTRTATVGGDLNLEATAKVLAAVARTNGSISVFRYHGDKTEATRVTGEPHAGHTAVLSKVLFEVILTGVVGKVSHVDLRAFRSRHGMYVLLGRTASKSSAVRSSSQFNPTNQRFFVDPSPQRLAATG